MVLHSAYWREGHREIVERNIALARLLGQRIADVPELRLLRPSGSTSVRFTLADEPPRERVHALAAAVEASGEADAAPTVYAGTQGLRAAFSNWRTTEADTERVFSALRSAALTASPRSGKPC